MKVLIAGFQHETNTFAPSRADWAAFERGDSFPPLMHGTRMAQFMAGINIPIAGFMSYANQQSWAIKPSIWAGATPSAHITEDAFERISAAILDDAKPLDFDAIYLDLHGAAVAEHIADCEGELLARLRTVVGPKMPIVASLDSHANVTKRMWQMTDALTCYRTYPHTDMAQTGMRAGQLLARRITLGQRESLAYRKIPFLLPLNSQSTMTEPNRSFTADLIQHEDDEAQVNFAMGFPAADFSECGASLWAYGKNAQAVVDKFYQRILSERAAWRINIAPAADAVERAIRLAKVSQGPVVVADTQDNPGAGADSNSTGMLHALLASGAGQQFPGQVALGLLYDPQAALAAHQAGLGAVIHIGIGRQVETGWQGLSDPPVERAWQIAALSDGKVRLEGPMMKGLAQNLGPSALLVYDGVMVCVVSGKAQMLDLALYRFLGVQPETMKLLVNKSSVHFRAAFAPIASHILVAKAPGPMAADPADLPWRHLPPGMERSA